MTCALCLLARLCAAPFLQLLGVLETMDRVEMGPAVDACLQKQASLSSLNQGANFTGPVIDAWLPPYNYPNISFSATQDPGVLNVCRSRHPMAPHAITPGAKTISHKLTHGHGL